jgi:hypothetical protein
VNRIKTRRVCNGKRIVLRPNLSVVAAQSKTARRLTQLDELVLPRYREGLLTYERIKLPKNGSSRPASEKKSAIRTCQRSVAEIPGTYKLSRC